MEAEHFLVSIANESHFCYIPEILNTIKTSAKERKTGIAERKEEDLKKKIEEGKAFIALYQKRFAGFIYIEAWGENKNYVSISSLIIHPNYRGLGLSLRLKRAALTLARMRWPKANLFSLTSSDAVMHMNTKLGYVPVSFKHLPKDENFWDGCKGCINYPILLDKNKEFCICTAMIASGKEMDKLLHLTCFNKS